MRFFRKRKEAKEEKKKPIFKKRDVAALLVDTTLGTGAVLTVKFHHAAIDGQKAQILEEVSNEYRAKAPSYWSYYYYDDKDRQKQFNVDYCARVHEQISPTTKCDVVKLTPKT